MPRTLTIELVDDGYDYTTDPDGRVPDIAEALTSGFPHVLRASLDLVEKEGTPVHRLIKEVRERHPSATALGLSSSDQGVGSGYVCTGLVLADGTDVNDLNGGGEFLEELEVEHLNDLSWGAFGDLERDSAFNVSLTTGRIIR